MTFLHLTGLLQILKKTRLRLVLIKRKNMLLQGQREDLPGVILLLLMARYRKKSENLKKKMVLKYRFMEAAI